MSSLRKPQKLEQWVALLRGELAIEEISEILEEPPSMIRLSGIPGFRIPVQGKPLINEVLFRKYLATYHTAAELELLDAAMVLTKIEHEPGTNDSGS